MSRDGAALLGGLLIGGLAVGAVVKKIKMYKKKHAKHYIIIDYTKNDQMSADNAARRQDQRNYRRYQRQQRRRMHYLLIYIKLQISYNK